MAEAVQTKVTAEEFARLPETNLPTELIDGEIIRIAAPKDVHQGISIALLQKLLGLIDGGVLRYSPSDVYLDEYNVVQPDIFWVSGPDSKCKLGEDDTWHGASDLTVEIHAMGAGLRDRREKFQLYEKYGTREYWLVHPGDRYIEEFQLVRGRFKRVGLFGPGETFESPLLGGKAVDLKAVFEVKPA